MGSVESRSTVIEKTPSAAHPAPNLADYARGRRAFSWEAARLGLDGLPDGRGLNIAYEAVDRHVVRGHGERTAIRWLSRSGDRHEISYGALAASSARFANVLTSLGVRPGERVFALTGRIPELYTTVLGTLKARAAFCPLFSAFGPEPIRQRLELGDGKVLVTTAALYRKKVAGLRESLPQLEHVIVIGDGTGEPSGSTHDFAAICASASDSFEIQPTDPEDIALLHFTSGTTGRPKGAIHVHDAVVSHHVTGRIALDLHPGDVYWCTADPGWVTGISYGVVSPLTNGVTMVVDEAEFEAERWYDTLERERVSVWYTAPTAIRRMMRTGAASARERRLDDLRFIASVGEPLNPEAVTWGVEAFGLPIHDNWWQTETGGIMVANFASMPIRPGSMGRPMPGIDAAVVRRGRDGAVRDADGLPELVEQPGVEGELALRRGWPSMFRGYLHDEDRYEGSFAGDWYLTGDLVRRDEDGYFWFVGRADDVIKSAGHLIGPFEVESALLEHDAVAEAGVIGIPDPVAGEIVKAHVTLKPGVEPSDSLRRELIGFARTRLGPAVAPRAIEFDDWLPHTRSGKIMRRLVRARELGLPEGDTSTLEPSA